MQEIRTPVIIPHGAVKIAVPRRCGNLPETDNPLVERAGRSFKKYFKKILQGSFGTFKEGVALLWKFSRADAAIVFRV